MCIQKKEMHLKSLPSYKLIFLRSENENSIITLLWWAECNKALNLSVYLLVFVCNLKEKWLERLLMLNVFLQVG